MPVPFSERTFDCNKMITVHLTCQLWLISVYVHMIQCFITVMKLFNVVKSKLFV